MDRLDLYDKMAARKDKPKDYTPYDGGNGRVNKCVDLMKKRLIRTGGTLLDVGGGIGDLGYATGNLFDKKITMDISQLSLRAAAIKGNDVILADIDKNGLAGISDETIDVITALDFIEHIIDPENFARECARVLKPNGEVFINTPNIRFWRHIDQLLMNGTFPHTSGDKEVFHGGHLAFFTYSDLKLIFEPAGFKSSKQFKDEECYEAPPTSYIDKIKPTNQDEYVSLNLEFGCPNMLYKATINK